VEAGSVRGIGARGRGQTGLMEAGSIRCVGVYDKVMAMVAEGDSDGGRGQWRRQQRGKWPTNGALSLTGSEVGCIMVASSTPSHDETSTHVLVSSCLECGAGCR
jgi:hypothetical protein